MKHETVDEGEFVAQLAPLFRRLSPMPQQRISQLLQLSHLFHANMARELQPAINAHFRGLALDNLEDSRSAARWINDLLRQFHLGIRCPRTQKAAILVADTRDSKSDTVRWRLEIIDNERGSSVVKTLTSNARFDLELMERSPRSEALSGLRTNRPVTQRR